MTPVQLPEVPAHSYGFNPAARDSADAFRFRTIATHPEPLYTATQLREYATEAVRLNMKQFLPACEALKREAIREQIAGLTRGDPGKIANADRLIALLTQPEQNSER